jgi:hypothetical protein
MDPVIEEQAHRFVDAADFSGLPDYQSPFGVLGVSGFVPEADRSQSVVVGSGINAFVKGVTDDRRTAINDSALFAQLVANRKVPQQTDITAWYDAYFDALTNIGWVMQSRSFVTYQALSQDVDVNEAILTIASGLLGGTAAVGYQLIRLTLESLHRLADSSPWITTFRRESQHERAARFQVSLVNQDAEKDFLVSLMAFDLQAEETLNQVLFFKFKSTQATLKQLAGDVTINSRVLSAVGPKIAAKIDAFYDGYV